MFLCDTWLCTTKTESLQTWLSNRRKRHDTGRWKESKKRILELYLNVAEWGDHGIFGIEEASRHYYGKPASLLDAQEASRLAAILPNPRKYSPLGNSRYVTNRAHIIYSIMVKRGIVVPEYNEIIDVGTHENHEETQGTETIPENENQ